MRWHFGGNLQPVRMICEYDWKECPTAVVSYIWSEIVTDVVDGLTGDAHLWRILAILLLCSMLLRTVYYKIRWIDKSEDESTRDHLIKVGLKMQDLELKINILTYKMQYGIWPLLHEIPTPSLTQLKNVKLTLSNTGRQNIWRKHNLHRCISQCIQNSEDDKSTRKRLSASMDRMELVHRNFLSQFRDKNEDFEAIKFPRNSQLLQRENDCKSYERLVRTAKECRKYMNEINESNKSLGLIDQSSDISDPNSIKDYCVGTESEPNDQGFLIDQKRWSEISKRRNAGETAAVKECELRTFDQILSSSNYKRMDTMFPTDNERYTLTGPRSKSKLLPPGLSITFLSDKFKTFPSSEKSIVAEGVKQNKEKSSINQTLNKVKEKLEGIHDVRQVMESSRSLNYLKENPQGKKRSETNFLGKRKSTTNTCNCDGKYGKKIIASNNSGRTNFEKLDQLISTECDSSCSGNNEATLNPIPSHRGSGIPMEKMRGRYLYPGKEREEAEARQSKDRNTKSTPKSIIKSFTDVGSGQFARDSGSNNMNSGTENSSNAYNDSNKNTLPASMKMPSISCCVEKSLSKLALREENLSTESDSSASFTYNIIPGQNHVINSNIQFDSSEDVVTWSNNNKTTEDNINLRLADDRENVISKTKRSYLGSIRNKSKHPTPMEMDDDPTCISETSSQTELSKDSDGDKKSTTTLLREALGFKKALLLQIQRESETSEDKILQKENSECDSDDTCRSKTDNRFPSKILDIISEEQSASSSTEKTSRTYIVSKSVNEANLCENFDKPSIENNNTESLNICKITLDGECCGDSRSPVTATSSEYFSTNNVTDNEHTSSQKINQPVADGDGIGDAKISQLRKLPEDELNLHVTKYENSNSDNLFSDANLNENEGNGGTKSSVTEFGESRDIKNKQDTIFNLQSPASNEKWENNLAKLNNFSEMAKSPKDVGDKGKSVDEICNKQAEKMKERRDAIGKSTGSKDDAKVQFFRSWSSIDSEKGISWNSISESSSSESMTNFVNALTNLESKNIDKITEQKLMMLNSTDYEGRNFARAGENAQYNFNSRAKKQPGLVSMSDINISERGHGLMDEILEVIAHSAIFKCNKTETKAANASTSATDAANETSAENQRAEESGLFKSHSMLKLDQEKLQRKQDILSKLKTLDAFTKPLDISECNSEKNDNEENASPMTGRTVVCISNINTTKNNGTSNKTEREMLEERFPPSSSTSENIEQKKVGEESRKGVEGSETPFIGAKISSTQRVKASESPSIDHQVSECDMNSQSDNTVTSPKKNQMSKSSITNFSTDTSDSYFDVSNHDFAVSSIILTSQNSNLAPRSEDHTSKSDTSSLYVDASDYCSKITIDSSLAKSNTASNLARKKNCFSESQIVDAKTDGRTNTHQEDVATHNNLRSKHEVLIKAQLPRSTSSLLSDDREAQLMISETEFHAETKQNLGESKSRRSKDPIAAESGSSLNQDASKRSSSLNLERSCARVGSTSAKGKTTSKSCIPVLKSRIEIPKRAKSVEAKPCSQSPVRRSSTPRSQRAENSFLIEAAASDNINETGKQTKQSANGSRKLLNRKQSYILPPKNDTREESARENNECKIVESISKELAITPEKCNLLSNSGNSPKECTVIYINIISDADRSETQTVDANEIIKYVNKDAVFHEGKLDGKCLSLRNITPDRSKETTFISDSKLCKNLSEVATSESDKASNTTKSAAPLEQEEKCSEGKNNSETIMRLSKSVTKTANKLLSTSTLELSNAVKVEQREIEVSAKPSVKNTSTSVSDFPETSPVEKYPIYHPNLELFDLSKKLAQKEQIVLSEMLNSDPNFFECRKTHRLYNKLGLGFQEQTEQP